MSALEQAVREVVDTRLRELGILGVPVVTTANPNSVQAAQPAPYTAAPLQPIGRVDCCFKCGAQGEVKQQRDTGLRYWQCPDETCGFQGRDRFVRSSWDETNWQERRDRVAKYAGRA